ncbi:DUF533 domain-containing protein, partial [Rhodobacterales bacterium HKCCE3408]|nr:DUF533 domain-containing protein [Rhodobacterales bacterium HKCCE3408]
GDLGALLGGGAAGGALGQLLGGRGSADSPDFGNRLNQALATGDEPKTPPTVEEEAIAGLMIRAMIMAAKSDGRIDADERAKLLGSLKGADPEEMAFIEEELARPVDIDAFAGAVPDDPGLRRQVYATALMAIDLDSRAEAQFMADLAAALSIPPGDLDLIHGKMGANPFA